MKKLILSILVLNAIHSAALAHAYYQDMDSMPAFSVEEDALDIGELTITDVTEEYKSVNRNFQVPKQDMRANAAASIFLSRTAVVAEELNQVEVIVDKVINIGTKIWTVVDKIKGVQTTKDVRASALPTNVTDSSQLDNWKEPIIKTFRVSYGNKIGSLYFERIRFNYNVILIAGGDYRGVGKYIQYVGTETLDAYTMMPFNLQAEAEVMKTYNKGSRENPVAQMVLTVRWTVDSKMPVKPMKASQTIFLDGNGVITAPGVN